MKLKSIMNPHVPFAQFQQLLLTAIFPMVFGEIL